jgi:hypothetical protein
MQDASGMIDHTEARAAFFPPRPSLCVGDIKRVHRKRRGILIKICSPDVRIAYFIL